MSSVARRYATALVDSASASQTLEPTVRELESLAAALAANPELSSVLLNPVFTPVERKKVLDALLTKLALSPVTLRFVQLLSERSRFDLVADVAREARRLADARGNRLRAFVDTAAPLTADAEADLRKALEQRTGKAIELVVRIDPMLLGGIRVRVGSIVLDGTIRSHLGALRESLLRAE